MIKIVRQVLIAVDPKITDCDLCQKIDWSAHSFNKVHQAADKKSALALYCDLWPQLVLIGLDPVREAGLEFYIRIKEAGDFCSVILLYACPELILPGQSGFSHIQDWLLRSRDRLGSCRLTGPDLAVLPDLISQAKQPVAETLMSSKDFWAAKMKEYVRQNYPDCELSIAGIAAAFNLGAPYAGTIFKQIEGISLVQYIMQYRCKVAIRLLADPGLRIHQVSQLVGVPDPNYFARCFKKMIGLTPKEYRILVTAGKR